MKKRTLTLLLIIFLLCTGSIFAGGQQEASAPKVEGREEISFTFTDSSGREITITKPIERIVFSHRSIGEALKIVDVWDKVVGVDGYTSDEILYPNVNELPDVAPVQNPYDINYEKVFELKPDVLFTWYMPMPGFDEMVDTLEPEVTVIALDVWTPDTIIENFRNLGIILGKETEAEEFIAFYKGIETKLTSVTSKLENNDKPGMLYKTGWGEAEELMTYSDKTPGFPYRCEVTGCINIAADLPSQGGWVQSIDQEWLIEQNPDVVIVSGLLPGGFGLDVDDHSAAEAYRKKVMDLTVFSKGTAAGNNDVYMLSSEFYGTSRYIIGFAYMAKWFHPDLFSDLDPQSLHQEYLTRFMRIDFDLSKHGVFVYPEAD